MTLNSPLVKNASVGSAFLVDSIKVQTTLPYHSGAEVVWFSPAVDFNLHQILVRNGIATLGTKDQIIVKLDGEQLITSRVEY
jgi:hypothetical protein